MPYRLADLFYGELSSAKDRDLYLSNWPDSLASKYMQARRRTGDLQALLGVIKAARIVPAPPRSSCVVHLRVGDVIERPGSFLSWLGIKGNSLDVRRYFTTGEPTALWKYVKHRGFYSSRVQELRRRNVTRIVLMAAAHNPIEICGTDARVNGCTMARSSTYVDLVREYFVSEGFAVDYRLGHPSDEDVRYVTQATCFIAGGGGFGRLLASIAHGMHQQLICPCYKPRCFR